MQLDELAKIAQLPDDTLVRDAEGEIWQVWRDRKRDPATTWLHHFSDEYGAIVRPDGTPYAHSDIKLPLTVLEVRDAPDPGQPHDRDTPEAAAERAAWLLDIARMLRGRVAVAPDLRAGYLDAANWLDPSGRAGATSPGAKPPPAVGRPAEPNALDQLTEGERRYLAMHAGYAADREQDPRYWHPDTAERERLVTRWREIAHALHPDPFGIATEETK